MNLLLTGASGFLGRNLLRHAPAGWQILALYRHSAAFPEFVSTLNNPNITAVQCDLDSPEDVAGLFRKFGNDWESCLYLAAKVDIPWSVRDPRQDLLLNTGALLNLLEVLRAKRFVYLSSGAVYDGLSGEIHPHSSFSPTLPYAISKLACERYVEFYGVRRGSLEKFLIVRFFGAYGPYEAPHKIHTRLVRTFAIQGKSSYTMYGNGRNLIDAMYVEDAVTAIQKILTGDHWNDMVNLAGGQPVTVEALIQDVGRVLGIPHVTIEREGVAHESNQFWGSTREMRDCFGFEPKISLPEGLSRFRAFLTAADQPFTIDHQESRG
jgi:nucleoside-diphosphate-sugar epimerase